MPNSSRRVNGVRDGFELMGKENIFSNLKMRQALMSSGYGIIDSTKENDGKYTSEETFLYDTIWNELAVNQGAFFENATSEVGISNIRSTICTSPNGKCSFQKNGFATRFFKNDGDTHANHIHLNLEGGRRYFPPILETVVR